MTAIVIGTLLAVAGLGTFTVLARQRNRRRPLARRFPNGCKY